MALVEKEEETMGSCSNRFSDEMMMLKVSVEREVFLSCNGCGEGACRKEDCDKEACREVRCLVQKTGVFCFAGMCRLHISGNLVCHAYPCFS